jgi:uncharacterized repeat protein (TIGR03803 family)
MAAAALLSGCIAHELPVAGSLGTTPSLRVPTTPQAYRVLHRFGRSKRVIGGYHPAGLLAYHGTLYGTAHDGGKYGYGTVYSITPPGALHVVYSFGGTQNDGFNPSAGVIAVDGVLYGVTDGGGACGAGTVFSLTTSGAEKVLHSFCGADGGSPQGAAIAVNGVLYGTASTLGGSKGNVGGTVFTITTSGAYRVMHRFRTTKGDGFTPTGSLAIVKGVLYGTTLHGGTGCSDYPGCGTIYRITTTGKEKVVYSFTGLPGSDGSQPEGGVNAVNGALYGTTFLGGDGACHEGCGIAYRATINGTESVLYRFDAAAGGQNPAAGVVDVRGTLYGTTAVGGGGSCGNNEGCGTVYRLTTSGTETVLHAFAGPSDGADPEANLVVNKGRLYGLTTSGGIVASRCTTSLSAPDEGCGTVFSTAPE